MHIMPINKLSFKSFLPKESKPEKGDCIRDYWGDFAQACRENPESKEKLDTLLNELANNGDDNILALETTKGMTNMFQDNYYFRLYANNDDLLADRKYFDLTSQDRHISKELWIQPMSPSVVDGNFKELRGGVKVGKKHTLAHFRESQCFFADDMNMALLHCLEKIVRDPEKKMFDLKDVPASKYLKQFRVKV